jgi:hypothetical protein
LNRCADRREVGIAIIVTTAVVDTHELHALQIEHIARTAVGGQ